jgi:WD40 repeat protein
MLSVGHENYLNVWSIEASVTRAFVCKYEGHSAPVVSAKYFDLSPFAVSIDEKFLMKFWDVRTHTCIQQINNQTNWFEINGIFTFKDKQFSAYGKRFVCFDTFGKEDSAGPGQDSNYAISAFFN